MLAGAVTAAVSMEPVRDVPRYLPLGRTSKKSVLKCIDSILKVCVKSESLDRRRKVSGTRFVLTADTHPFESGYIWKLELNSRTCNN